MKCEGPEWDAYASDKAQIYTNEDYNKIFFLKIKPSCVIVILPFMNYILRVRQINLKFKMIPTI